MKILINTDEEVNNALLELGKSSVIVQNKEAAMNEEIQKIKARYDDDEELAEANGNIALYSDALENYLTSHKKDFIATRSKIYTHGKIGFRTTPPSVKQLNSKWKVESSIAFLKKLFKKTYLREKPEINKDLILADYASGKLADEDLAGVGLRVDQNEKFIIESNWEEIKQSSSKAA